MQLLLFTDDLELARPAVAGGVQRVVVDWECSPAKRQRQRGYDTEISGSSTAEVRMLSSAVPVPVVVRVNPLSSATAAEVRAALDAGARSLMLPMARRAEQVRQFLECVAGRAECIVQIEHVDLLAELPALNMLGWDSTLIGLNDLMISSGSSWLWQPVYEGTVQRVVRALAPRPVGFGGLTRIGFGAPLPTRLLLGEMQRVGAQLTVLRRSFKRDVAGFDVSLAVQEIHAAWSLACARSPATRGTEQGQLHALLGRLQEGAAVV